MLPFSGECCTALVLQPTQAETPETPETDGREVAEGDMTVEACSAGRVSVVRCFASNVFLALLSLRASDGTRST